MMMNELMMKRVYAKPENTKTTRGMILAGDHMCKEREYNGVWQKMNLDFIHDLKEVVCEAFRRVMKMTRSFKGASTLVASSMACLGQSTGILWTRCTIKRMDHP